MTMYNKIKLTCVEKPKPSGKLMFVKIIKMATGLGLKESKDIADSLFDNLNTSVEIELVENPEKTEGLKPIDYLKSNLTNCGGQIKVTGALEWQRNYKMLTLGLGDDKEYVDFLSEYLSDYKKVDFLKMILSKLEKQELIELINKIEI